MIFFVRLIKKININQLLTFSLIFFGINLNAYDVNNPALFPVKFKKAPVHPPLELVKNGKAQFAIIYNYNLSEKDNVKRGYEEASIQDAVKILKEGFRRCFGIEVPVLSPLNTKEIKKYRYRFLLGDSLEARKLGVDVRKLPKAGFEIKTFKDGIIIAGYDGSTIKGCYDNMTTSCGLTYCGTRHGVVDFLERFLGCRFYYPGELGEIFPKQKKLTIKPVNYYDFPRTYTRGLGRFCPDIRNTKKWEPLLGKYKVREDQLYRRFEKLWRIENNTEYLANHSPEAKRLLKAHPDKEDIIVFHSNDGTAYPKYFDITNLKLADLLVSDFKRFYETNGKYRAPWTWDAPTHECVAFGINDIDVPASTMLNKPAVKKLGLMTADYLTRKNGELSDVYARFCKYLSERVAKELPGKKLGLMAYASYTRPPLKAENMPFADNVEMRICLMQLPGRVRNPKVVKQIKGILGGWMKVLNGRKIHSLWMYNSPSNPFARAMNLRYLNEVPETFKDYISGEDFVYNFWFEVEWYYYCSIYPGWRSLWNPNINVKAILDEHWELMYGKAAPFIKACDTLLEKCYNKYYMPKSEAYVIYPLFELKKMEELLRKAKAAVKPGSIEARRVRLFSYPWAKAIANMNKQRFYQRQIYIAGKVSGDEKIVIDGNGREKAWKNAKKIKTNTPEGGEVKFKSKLKMLWDKNGIYVFGKFDNKYITNKDDIFRNCNLEFFISPKMEQKEFYQVVFGVSGNCFSGRRVVAPITMAYDATWKCKGLKYAVKKDDNGWSLEAFVPFAGIHNKAPQVYDSWYFNLVYNKLSAPKESAATCLTLNSNHNVKQYSMIKFGGEGDGMTH